MNRDQIREIFLRNGFTVKEGQSDLKPYVYAAAEELLQASRPASGDDDLAAAQGSMQDFARAADLIQKVAAAATNGEALAAVLSYRKDVRLEALADGGKGEASLTRWQKAQMAFGGTAPQAECAPREAQPVAPAKDRARSFVRDLMRDLKRESGFLMSDREQEVILNAFIKFAAPTPERADADTAEAKPQTDAEALYDAWESTIAYMGEQRAATPASQERADAGKDAAPPMQPLVVDRQGTVRFAENAVVRHLLDKGSIDLNALAVEEFSDADRAQFAQLIGYSVSGYGELHYVSDESYERAAAQVDAAILAANKGN
jgi:hypothetical protein